MTIQIISIPRCYKKSNNWLLEIYGITPNRTVEQLSHPLAATPKLPIGGAIKPDKTISRNTGFTEQINFKNFDTGRIITLEEIGHEIYSFTIPNEIQQHSRLYEVKTDDRTYVFFCYEIFRAFLCWDNNLIKYLFQYDVLDSFIDNESIQKIGNKTHATLEINEAFPKQLLGNTKKLEKYILLVYNESFKKLRHSILSQRTENYIDFSFGSLDFKELTLSCQAKEFNKFTLIYSINSIDSPIHFPFDELSILHSSIKSKKQSKSEGKSTKTAIPFKHANSHETNDSEAANKVSHEDFSVLPLEYKFDREVQIEKIRLNTSESKGKNETTKIPKHQIGDVQFSLSEEDDNGNGVFQNLNRDADTGTFDYSQVPEGLISFTKAINILSNTIGKDFTYWIANLDEGSSFSRINNTGRKAIVVRFDVGSPIYFVEIDSSDNRFISTLLLHSINTPNHKKYIDLVLDHTAKNHGRWPEKEITSISQFITIRHPQSRKKEKDLSEKAKSSLYLDRIAWKYYRCFRN